MPRDQGRSVPDNRPLFSLATAGRFLRGLTAGSVSEDSLIRVRTNAQQRSATGRDRRPDALGRASVQVRTHRRRELRQFGLAAGPGERPATSRTTFRSRLPAEPVPSRAGTGRESGSGCLLGSLAFPDFRDGARLQATFRKICSGRPQEDIPAVHGTGDGVGGPGDRPPSLSSLYVGVAPRAATLAGQCARGLPQARCTLRQCMQLWTQARLVRVVGFLPGVFCAGRPIACPVDVAGRPGRYGLCRGTSTANTDDLCALSRLPCVWCGPEAGPVGRSGHVGAGSRAWSQGFLRHRVCRDRRPPRGIAGAGKGDRRSSEPRGPRRGTGICKSRTGPTSARAAWSGCGARGTDRGLGQRGGVVVGSLIL